MKINAKARSRKDAKSKLLLLMTKPQFQPGFRISKIDGAVIVVGLIATAALWPVAWWLGFAIAFVVAHFFLFCNVFRLARPLELGWSAVFVALVSGTVLLEKPSWAVIIGITLLTTFFVILLEMRKPSYHGVLWQRINPGLPEWWKKHSESSGLRLG